MTSSPAADWRDIFCGRAEQLSALDRLYREVATGGGPRLCVVLGDRGMGKTRLVQEFYRHLAAQHDPHDYWPDASLFAGNNLRVAPDLEDPRTLAHFSSFVLEQRPMPFLWWGFRLADPVARNAAAGGLAAHRDTLDLHLVPALFGRRRSRLAESLTQSAREHGAQLGKKVVLDLVKAIPAVGSVATLFEWGVELSERAGQAAAAATKARGEDRQQHGATLSRLGEDRVTGLLERTFDDLADVLAPREGLTPLPTVVFCDDAQFAGPGADEGALRLLEGLWERAHLGGWPLLLVLTHWAVEWHQRVAERAQDAQGRSLHCPGSFERTARSSHFGCLLELPVEPELVQLIRSGLPGLLAADEQLLLRKADGNPQLLVELVELVRRSSAWRPAGQSGLTDYARGQIESRSSKLVELIRERLESPATPQHVRQGVALSSVQGVKFLCSLTHAAAKALTVQGSTEGLEQAQHPHRLVVDVEAGVAGFVQRAYCEAAESLVGQYLGEPSLVRAALVRAAIGISDNEDRWAALTPVERSAALGVLAALGERDADAQVRLHAARALLQLLEEAMQAERGADYVRAAELAARFEAGLDSGWSLTAFGTHELVPVCQALSEWHGHARASRLIARVLARAREWLAADGHTDVHRQVMVWAMWAGLAAQAQGRWKDAVESYREVLAIGRRLADELRTPEAQRDLSSALAQAARAAQAQGSWDEAESLHRESLLISRQLVDTSGTPQSRQDLASVLIDVGNIAQAQGRLDEAELLYREALAASRALAVEDGTPDVRRGLVVSLNNVGDVALARGRWAEGTAAYLESLKVCREMAEQLGRPDDWRNVGACLNNLARFEAVQGRWEEAEALYRESLGVNRRLAGQWATPGALQDVATVLNNVGDAAAARGRPDEAESHYRESLELRRRLAQLLGTPEARRNVAQSLDNVGKVEQARGRWDEADALYRESLEICRELARELNTPAARRDVSAAADSVAEVARVRGRWDEAEALSLEVLAFSRELAEQLGTPDARRNLCVALGHVGHAAQARGRWDEAEALYRRSLAIRRELVDQLGTPGSRRDLCSMLDDLGAVARANDRLDEAESLLRESLAVRRELAEVPDTPQDRWDLSTSLTEVGRVAQARGNWDEAADLHRESVKMSRELADQLGTPAALRRLGIALWHLAGACRPRGEREVVCQLLREAHDLFGQVADAGSMPRAREELELVEAQLRKDGCGSGTAEPDVPGDPSAA